jgi:hypothetical protein
MIAASAPAQVVLPKPEVNGESHGRIEDITIEDKVYAEEICPNWQGDHGKSEAQQFPDDRSASVYV